MLKITYIGGGIEKGVRKVAEYDDSAQFVANQQLEVPDFEDYLKIVEVTDDGKKLDLSESTMHGLYNYLINK